MIAFLSIVITVVLLGITVYGLHRYQTMEVEYTVDRSMPLPPLDDEQDKSPLTDTVAAVPVSEAITSPAAELAQAEPPKEENWLDRVAALKKADELDAALALCEAEFPLWGAYNQACIILRTQLRSAEADGQTEEILLKRLYQLAANAELLHDKSPQATHYTLSQLKELNLAQLQELVPDYQELGYAHLRLIRKSDIKLMQARWGKVHDHALPRDLYQDWWQEYTRQLV